MSLRPTSIVLEEGSMPKGNPLGYLKDKKAGMKKKKKK
jgi:hypothetical protein